MSLPCLLFAAGLGTRMHPLTLDRPKPLVRVGGTTLLDHAMDIAESAGAAPRVVNLHYLGDQIRHHLAGRDVLFSDETATLLETGGGLRHALPLLGGGPVMTLNTDAVWAGPNPLDLLSAAWEPEEMGALLMLISPDRATAHSGPGDFLMDASGRLGRGPGLIYGGAQIIESNEAMRPDETVFSLNRLWDLLATEERLFGLVYPGHWCDVGRPSAITQAEAMMAQIGGPS